jgi:uncharacterized protein YjbI with pentapeptide repeats
MKKIDLYEELYDKVLKETELRRPIFAYMIYKLVISNTNFIDFGKVGVYISFLNQLSRDAKHKDDLKYKVSLKDEFVYRNILHASALLWQFKRQSGEQTSLTIADICRTIDENEIDKNDNKVLIEFKEINSIKFLSHSYLGEKENTLHFQHQSFAEILLAEYYLKVFIKHAFEENIDFEEARIKLSIGMPTDQTIEFFNGLLLLLKDCVFGDINDSNTISKRELFIPLLASMAIKEHNKKLYSDRLYTKWFEDYEDKLINTNKLDSKMIENFPINQKVFDKIEKLCINIINSTKSYVIDESTRKTILFKDELVRLNNLNGKLYEIDKWFALIVGNVIATDISKMKFFNSQIDAKQLFNLIKSWNYNVGYLPSWGRSLFIGINLKNNVSPIKFSYLNLSGVDFSYSYLKMLTLNKSTLYSCNFSNSTFEFFNIIESNISGSVFDEIKIIQRTKQNVEISDIHEFHFEGDFCLTFCYFSQGVLFPKKLNTILKGKNDGLVDYSGEICQIDLRFHEERFLKEYFAPLKGIFKNIISKGHNADFIISVFKFNVLKNTKEQNETKHFIEIFKKYIYDIENELKNT